MTRPQAGILPEPGKAALFLVLEVRDAGRDGRAVCREIARVPRVTAAVAKLDRRAKLVCTVALGSGFWDTVSPDRRPRGLRPFAPIEADARRAPATGGDLFLHVTSQRPDLNFELALRLRSVLGETVAVMEEVAGFRYLDSRDLTGFVDGTENPKGRAREKAALIGAEDRGFAGGSYVVTQRYVHDLRRWATVSPGEQEAAIGRRKRDSKELSPRVKPPTAHISRVVIEEDGEELQIVRRSFPYGSTSEAGLFFVAYTKDLRIPERMLGRMMGAAGDGHHDRLMEFTRAVSGANFFAPSLSVLESLGRAC